MSSQRIRADGDGHEFDFQPIDCPTCERRDYSVLGFRGGEHHRYGLGVATRIVRCRSCGLIYCDPFPFPVKPQDLYGDPEKYFGYEPLQKVIAQGGIIEELRVRANSDRPSVLDVGSGRGELLRAAVLAGLTDVVGLEFSDAMIAYAQERFGITVEKQSIEEHADVAGRRYDAVVLSAVLEHVHRPDAMIEAVARLTAPGAIIYLDVPNEPNLLTVVGNGINRLRHSSAVLNLSPTFPPYHVFGFNRRSLRALLAKHSFSIESCTVWAEPHIPSTGDPVDRAKAFAATQLNRFANVARSSANMTVWARRR